MEEDYAFYKKLFMNGVDLKDIYREIMDNNEDYIVNYKEDELYKLLTEKGIKFSMINQIMKLYKIGYPLPMGDVADITIDELRDLVKRQETLQTMCFDIKVCGLKCD